MAIQEGIHDGAGVVLPRGIHPEKPEFLGEGVQQRRTRQLPYRRRITHGKEPVDGVQELAFEVVRRHGVSPPGRCARYRSYPGQKTRGPVRGVGSPRGLCREFNNSWTSGGTSGGSSLRDV
jgi:hypothetical protein